MTGDEADMDAAADLALLSMANHKRKFGLAVGLCLDAPLQYALERGIDNDWFRLVDVSRAVVSDGQILRIFRLTEAGLARLGVVGGRRQ